MFIDVWGLRAVKFIDLKKMGIEEGSTVIFSFGEIDVRCHIGKQAGLKGRDVNEVIETLAKKYIQTILENRAKYQAMTCIVYNVVPPVSHGGSNPVQPVYGPIEDRIRNTKQLNRTLQFELIRSNLRRGLVDRDCFEEKGPIIVPAKTFLSQLI